MTYVKKKDAELYTREQLREAKEFAARKDLVMAIVSEKERISKEELKKRIKEFLERSVR